MKNKKAIDLMRLVWTCHHKQAWMGLNHSMYQALRLSIGSNMEWDVESIREVNQTMRPSYWMGEHGWEYPYGFAIAVGNMSFFKAFEEYAGRPPFFGNLVGTGDPCGYIHSWSPRRSRERLALGSRVGGGTITSIGTDFVILCHYEGHDRKPKKREKLTREMVLERWPAPKKLKTQKPDFEVI